MDEMITKKQAIEVVQNRHYMLTKEKVLLINDLEKLPSAQPYTIHSDGRLWVTVDDIDKVTAVVVDEHKSKFCKQFYEDYEDYEDAQPEIIYCKNCKHFIRDDREEHTPYGFYNTYFSAFCDKHWDKEQGEYIDVKLDDYCSFAERREVTE